MTGKNSGQAEYSRQTGIRSRFHQQPLAGCATGPDLSMAKPSGGAADGAPTAGCVL
jgi:hypothetical protein